MIAAAGAWRLEVATGRRRSTPAPVPNLTLRLIGVRPPIGLAHGAAAAYR